MKKPIFKTLAVVAALASLAPATAAAQDSAWRFNYDVAMAITNYKNYSGLSLLPDATADYSALTSQYTFGVERKGFGLALRYSFTGVNTSAIARDERAALHEISLLLRTSVPVTQQLELVASVGVGYLNVNNILRSPAFEAMRHGVTAEAEIELRYHISQSIYLFARAGIGYSQAYTRPDALPNEATLGPKQGFLNTRLGGGIGIGFPPRTKQLSSPSELCVADGDYPLLVEYR